jgi:putative AlgH/UPF0301 family transcriptional regulator
LRLLFVCGCRHGAPIEGLQAGSLLVAHGASLQGTMFAQAVVLITEKSARGAKGVMLTQVRMPVGDC